jgi:hypothetical protein
VRDASSAGAQAYTSRVGGKYACFWCFPRARFCKKKSFLIVRRFNQLNGNKYSASSGAGVLEIDGGRKLVAVDRIFLSHPLMHHPVIL